MTYAYVLIREEYPEYEFDPSTEELHGVYSSVYSAVQAMRDDDTPNVSCYYLYRCVLDDPEGERYFVGLYDEYGQLFIG